MAQRSLKRSYLSVVPIPNAVPQKPVPERKRHPAAPRHRFAPGEPRKPINKQSTSYTPVPPPEPSLPPIGASTLPISSTDMPWGETWQGEVPTETPRDRSRVSEPYRPAPQPPAFQNRTAAPATPQSRPSYSVPDAPMEMFPTQRQPRPNGDRPSSASASRSDARSSKPRQRPQRRTKPNGSFSVMMYAARLVVLGMGMSAIAGTVLSIWHASVEPEALESNAASTPVADNRTRVATLQVEAQLGQAIAPLETQLQGIAAQYPDLQLGAFLLDVGTGAYANVGGDRVVAAASTIKFPILIAFFQAVDAGTLHFEESLEMRPEHVAEGSGDMQYQSPGTRYTALETAIAMMVISDNTATNMLIERLGGMEALNQAFQSWGLEATRLKNILPDLEGTNTTTPQELTGLMAMVERGELLSMRSRDRLFEIMRQTANNSLLPQGLGEGATIAHKTGDIGSVLADVGTIDLPNGKRYITAVTVQRPYNDDRAAEVIRQVSAEMYQHFNQSTGTEPSGAIAEPASTSNANTSN